MHLGGLILEHRRGRLDHAAGRQVERADLVQDQSLVCQRLRDDDRRAQRRKRGGRGAIDPFDQLKVVLVDELESQGPLCVDGKLGRQVLMFLPNVKEDVLAQLPGPVRVGLRQPVELRREGGVQLVRHVGVLLELSL